MAFLAELQKLRRFHPAGAVVAVFAIVILLVMN